MRDPSCICDRNSSSQQRQIIEPQSEAMDRTCILTDTSWVYYCWATKGTPVLVFFFFFFVNVYSNWYCSNSTSLYVLIWIIYYKLKDYFRSWRVNVSQFLLLEWKIRKWGSEIESWKGSRKIFRKGCLRKFKKNLGTTKLSRLLQSGTPMKSAHNIIHFIIRFNYWKKWNQGRKL